MVYSQQTLTPGVAGALRGRPLRTCIAWVAKHGHTIGIVETLCVRVQEIEEVGRCGDRCGCEPPQLLVC